MDPNSVQGPQASILNTPVINCKYCHAQVLPNDYFCPNCGKKLKSPPAVTTITKQIYLYAVAVLLPPLGLWPGIKYLLDKNPKAKIIGAVLIALTVISLAVTIIITLNFLNSQANVAGDQLKQLENSGY